MGRRGVRQYAERPPPGGRGLRQPFRASLRLLLLLLALSSSSYLTPALAFPGSQPPVAAPAGDVTLDGYALGASPTRSGRYPYVARLLDPDKLAEGGQTHICGGVLIAPTIVLTAAHCLEDDYEGNPSPTVRFSDGKDFIYRETGQAIKHQGWENDVLQGFDLAILVLAEEVYGVQPVNVVDQPTEAELLDETLVLAIWGYQGEGVHVFEAPLHHVDLPYVANNACSAWYTVQGYDKSLIKGDMMCAGVVVGKMACKGASGSPLIRLGGSPEEDVVVGIISFGPLDCSAENHPPGVFTRLLSYAEDIGLVADRNMAVAPPIDRQEGVSVPAAPQSSFAVDVSPPEQPSGFCSSSPCAEDEMAKIPVEFCSTSDSVCVDKCGGFFCPLPGYALGASPTRSGRYPYVAMLLDPDKLAEGGQTHICGGVLIAPTIVLTAAHCLEDDYEGNPSPTVRFSDGKDFIYRETGQAIKHQGWENDVLQGFDLAILVLAEEVYGVQPVNVVDQPTEGELLDETLVLAIWGYQGEGVHVFEAPLHHVDLPYVASKVCSAWYTVLGFDKSLIQGDMMCAGGVVGKMACKGASGSPLIRLGGSPEEDVVVGIMSFGHGDCSAGNHPPRVFTRLLSYAEDIGLVADRNMAVAPPKRT